MTRLFLADDHAILRDGLRALFEQEPSLHVVGEPASGEQLPAQLPATPCDVVLLDLHTPGPTAWSPLGACAPSFPLCEH